MVNSVYTHAAHSQRGIALFQVLLMVSIMGILLLASTQFANRSVEQARELERATHQRLALQSTHNWLEYRMAVQRWVGADSLQQALNINFYGEPSWLALPDRVAFEALDYEVSATIQNQRSLIDITRSDDGYLHAVLIAQGISDASASRLIEALQVAQQPWRTGQAVLAAQGQQRFLQLTNIAELESIAGWDRQLIDQVEPMLTAYGARLNQHLAPTALLNILLTGTQADIVAANRQQSMENDTTALTDAAVSLQSSPSREQQITLTSHRGITTTRLVLVRPRSQVPIIRHNNVN